MNLPQITRSSAKNGELAKNGWPDKREMYTTYKMSKVGVSALTRIQQRDFDRDPRPDLAVNHVHPGDVQTDMSEYAGELTVEQGNVSFVLCANHKPMPFVALRIV